MAGDTLMTVGGDLLFTDLTGGDNDFILGLASGFNTTVGTVFEIIGYTETRTGFFDNISDGETISISDFEFLVGAGGASNSVFTLETTAIPEPAHFAALAGLLGLFAVIALRRRR